MKFFSIQFIAQQITTLLLITITICSFSSRKAQAHGEENPVTLKPEIQKAQAGKVMYQFQLVENKSKKNLTPKDLIETHEKILHVFVYDPSLKEFLHLHPEYKDGQWTTELQLPVTGNYWVWTQGETKEKEFTVSTRLEIQNGQPPWPIPPNLKEERTGTDGESQASIEDKKIFANKPTMLNIKFNRTTNTTPEITSYLGAFAHIVITPESGTSLLHVHPMNNDNPTKGMIHTTFPKKGMYRVWIQFKDASHLKTIALAVKVL